MKRGRSEWYLVGFYDDILLVRPSSLRFALLSSSRKDHSFLCIIWELFEEKGLVSVIFALDVLAERLAQPVRYLGVRVGEGEKRKLSSFRLTCCSSSIRYDAAAKLKTNSLL